MEVSKAIKKRRSIRSYKQKIIPKELEKKLIDALIWAPSAGNLQSRKFYFVKDKTVKEKLVNHCLSQDFAREAPLIIVACADLRIGHRYDERGINLYSTCDTAISIQNLMLQAVDLGLGTCWIGSFNEEKTKQIIEIPKYLKPIAIIPVGFPDENPRSSSRLPESEVIQYR